MATELYRDENHLCLAFTDLVSGSGIQANQFLIVHDGHAALIDPGGALTYTPLSMAIGKYIRIKDLDLILASHQDPDIIASLDKWILYTDCKVAISRLWDRFLPHLIPGYAQSNTEGRIVSIPDRGAEIAWGGTRILALPAHFLHSVGNFSFYDPVSRILFSGDIGASVTATNDEQPVSDFAAHLPSMQGFHQRYMNSNRACRLWVNMVRALDVSMIVPQHGRPFAGQPVIGEFLDWLERLECGVDLMNQSDYSLG
jgi:flavorubredoxin